MLSTYPRCRRSVSTGNILVLCNVVINKGDTDQNSIWYLNIFILEEEEEDEEEEEGWWRWIAHG